MHKLILSLIMLWLYAAPCVVVAEFSFRGVTWGMDKQQVAAIETGMPVEPEDGSSLSAVYVLTEPVFGIDKGLVSYQFTGQWQTEYEGVSAGRLWQIAYRLGAYDAKMLSAAFEDYGRIQAFLMRQYGEPVLSGVDENGKMVYAFGPEYNGLEPEQLDAETARLLPLEELKFAVWNGPEKDYVVNLRLSRYEYVIDIVFSITLNEDGPTWTGWQNKEER